MGSNEVGSNAVGSNEVGSNAVGSTEAGPRTRRAALPRESGPFGARSGTGSAHLRGLLLAELLLDLLHQLGRDLLAAGARCL